MQYSWAVQVSGWPLQIHFWSLYFMGFKFNFSGYKIGIWPINFFIAKLRKIPFFHKYKKKLIPGKPVFVFMMSPLYFAKLLYYLLYNFYIHSVERPCIACLFLKKSKKPQFSHFKNFQNLEGVHQVGQKGFWKKIYIFDNQNFEMPVNRANTMTNLGQFWPELVIFLNFRQ